MKSKLLIYFLPVLLVMLLVYGYSTQDNPNSDTAPPYEVSSVGNSVNSVPGDTLYSFIVPNEHILGINKLPNSSRFVFTSGGQSSTITTDNIWIRTNLYGVRIDSFPQVNNTPGQGFGFRDLAWDGKYLLTSDNNQIRRIDTVTFTEPIPQITGPNNPNRGLAWSSSNRIWTSNFTTGPLAMIDTNGTTIKSLGIPPVAPYGLGADKWTSPGRMWIWYSQPSTTGIYRLSKIDTATGTIVQTFDVSTMFPATGSVGGLDVFNDHPDYPGRVVAAMVIQNLPTSIVTVIDLGPDSTSVGPGGGSITINRNGLNVSIPDNGGNANPAVDSIVISGIPPGNEIKKIRVTIDTVIHTYIGDLRFWLNHTATAFDTIISRVGYTGTGFGNSCDNFTGTVLLDTVGPINIQNIPSACIGVLAQATGTFNPKAPLAPFQNSGTNPNGSYILRISDNAAADLGSLRAWSIKIDYGLITGVSNQTTSIAETYKLSQNYPNPFNPSTKINYSIPKAGLVSIKVYDVLGKEVYTLVNEIKNPGSYEAVFNGANFSSGVYFYRIQAGNFVETKKMYLLK